MSQSTQNVRIAGGPWNPGQHFRTTRRAEGLSLQVLCYLFSMTLALVTSACGELELEYADNTLASAVDDNSDALGVVEQPVTASNGFVFPLDSLSSWQNANFGACGPTHYFTNRCHIGADFGVPRNTVVRAISDGVVIAQSATQDATCGSGWGYDYDDGSGALVGGTNTCNMALAVRHTDSNGNSFVVVYGHLVYNTRFRTGTGSVSSGNVVRAGEEIGRIGRWYNTSGGKISGDHLHFGVYPGTASPTNWGFATCTGASQASSTSLPSSCTYPGAQATAPGSYISARSPQVAAPTVAPASVSASDDLYTDRVRVSYSAVTGATRYYIFRALTSTGTYSQLGYCTGTACNDTTAVAGTYYFYKVRAWNSGGFGPYSNSDRGRRAR